jgi:hypothetical protein
MICPDLHHLKQAQASWWRSVGGSNARDLWPRPGVQSRLPSPERDTPWRKVCGSNAQGSSLAALAVRCRRQLSARPSVRFASAKQLESRAGTAPAPCVLQTHASLPGSRDRNAHHAARGRGRSPTPMIISANRRMPEHSCVAVALGAASTWQRGGRWYRRPELHRHLTV